MPKERFHLLIADEYLRSRQSPGTLSGTLARERTAFFLGAVSPDIFFYDLPTFSLGALGDRMHGLMERNGIAPIREWLSGLARTGPGTVPEAALAWGMGFASHFLADALWHPVINELAGSLDFCSKKGLSAIGCHRLIESEMEAFWLPRKGDPGAYAGLLERFGADSGLLGGISSIYRDFLGAAGLGPLPSVARIRRCFIIQNLLLRLFSNRKLGEFRDRLLDARFGRGLGALVVPTKPVLPSGPLSRVPADRDPFSDDFMEKRLTSLIARLSDLAERLSLSPPN
ncbi:MAG: zinc dependent phospholipase C family protein [Syntrophobacteraceae bacterium]